MSEYLFWLSDDQVDRLKPLLPNKVRGVPRGDDRKVIRYGLRWRDAPACYGPHKTLYNRFVRWSKAGGLRPHLPSLGLRKHCHQDGHDRQHPSGAHRTAASLLKGGAFPRQIGRTRGGLNSKLHAVCDGKPVVLLLTAGQVS